MKDIKQRSRRTLRLQIARGTDEEVLAAFEELMRRNWGRKVKLVE